MDRRTLLSAIAVTSAAALFAGCAPAWVVQSHAMPDPFRNQKEFAVLPIAFAEVRVGEEAKSETGYLADKTSAEAKAFFDHKAMLNAEYLRSLIEAGRAVGIHIVPATTPQTAQFLIRPSITSIDQGQGAKWPSAVRMLVRVGTMDGTVYDTVEIQNRSTAYAAEDRLRNDGQELGRTTVEYLKTRVIPGG
jgi:hypothetical protein